MKNHFAMFAAYNTWANKQLYAAAGALSANEFGKDVGAYFHSMKGTLNHLLGADRIWMRRFTGDGPAPKKLDEVLYEEFSELSVARKAEDRRIVRYVDSLEPEQLLGTITYTTITSPTEMRQNLSTALSHFFNHQTHHRGQAHTILSLLGRDPPPLDLLYFLRSDDGSAFR
jgi:uncharacterized damage-inducible protein DinB